MNCIQAFFRKFDRDFWIEVVSKWAVVTLLLLGVCVALRLYTIARLSLVLGFSVEQSLTILSGLYFDLLFLARFSLIALLPFVLIALGSIKVSSIIYSSFVGVYSLVYVGLVEYFANVKLPLDHVLLTYSAHDIVDIVVASTSLPVWFFLGLALFVAIFVLLIWLAKKIKVNRWVAYVLLTVVLLSNGVFRYKSVLYNELNYSSTANYNLAVNQFSYALHKIMDYKSAEDNYMSYEELLNAIDSYQALYPNTEFIDKSYPFMHKVEDADVLGPFLRTTSDSLPPSIVVIIIEGWGREISDVPNPVLSFTPFWDSLAQASLYWKNCLSTTERTFGVLPAMFASAPFGEKGFANVLVPVPNHHSLFQDVEKNGYQTAFYYGGCASFNGQDRFLKNNAVHHIMQVNVDSIQKYNVQEFKDFNRWGIDDKEMFQMAFDYREKNLSDRPSLEVYQTLTTHEPYVFKGCESYIAKVKQMAKRVASKLDKQPVERDVIQRYPQIFASFLYVDDCVRGLFDYYRSRPDFENTIFIITGDHRIGGKMDENPLRIYHVPLIVYSPLLKNSKEMAAVVSHWDITPTLNAYLKANYHYQISETDPWVGHALDTTQNYVCRQRVAFMRNNRDVVDYLHDDYFVVNQRVYKVLEDLQLEQIKDKNLQKRLMNERTNFAAISRYVSNNDYLMIPKVNENKRICHYVWDFEHTIPDYYHEIIKVYDGNNHCAIANTEHPYLPLMLPLRLEENYDRIFLDFSFDLKLSKSNKGSANVIVEISNDEGSAYYQYFDIYSETGQAVCPKQTQHCQFKTTLLLNGIDVKDKMLKVVVVSNHGTLVQLDNLEAKVEVLKK